MSQRAEDTKAPSGGTGSISRSPRWRPFVSPLPPPLFFLEYQPVGRFSVFGLWLPGAILTPPVQFFLGNSKGLEVKGGGEPPVKAGTLREGRIPFFPFLVSSHLP